MFACSQLRHTRYSSIFLDIGMESVNAITNYNGRNLYSFRKVLSKSSLEFDEYGKGLLHLLYQTSLFIHLNNCPVCYPSQYISSISAALKLSAYVNTSLLFSSFQVSMRHHMMRVANITQQNLLIIGLFVFFSTRRYYKILISILFCERVAKTISFAINVEYHL